MRTDCSRLKGPDWLTTTQAYKALGITRDLLFRAMRLGELPFSETPGGWRKIHRRDIEAYRELLEERLVTVSEEEE